MSKLRPYRKIWAQNRIHIHPTGICGKVFEVRYKSKDETKEEAADHAGTMGNSDQS